MILSLCLAALSLHVNLDDLKPFNDNKPILIPGIAADERVVSLRWTDEALSELADESEFVGADWLIKAEKQNPNDVRGVKVDFASSPKLSDKFFKVLESGKIEYTPKNEETGEVSITLNFKDKETADSAGDYFDEIPEPPTVIVKRKNKSIIIEYKLKLKDRRETRLGLMDLLSVVGIVDRLGDDDEESAGVAKDPEEASYDVVTVPIERQDELRRIEGEYFRRQFFDPVKRALADEDEQKQQDWGAIVQTAEDSLYYYGGGILKSWREYLGRGATEAFKKGCNYPLPIAFSYASLIKKDEDIHEAFRRVWESLEHDRRWNAATGLMFNSMLWIGDNRGSGEYPPKATMELEAQKAFLREAAWTTNELGAVFHLLTFASHGDVLPAIREVESEGVVIDPWLKTLAEASDAHDRAWAARGSGYASTVTRDGWRIYESEIAKVLPLCEKAYAMRPDLPHSTQIALSSCYGQSDKMSLWVKRARACRRDFLPAFTQYLFGSRPRWGGTQQKMAEFCLALAREGDFETMAPIFAYERIVEDVFASEGGVTLESGRYPNIDRFIEKTRTAFEPYFEGYRKSVYANTKAHTLEKMHVAVALADLAWRLGDAEELSYWTERIDTIGMPVKETQFKRAYELYAPYLPQIKKLHGERRDRFVRGVHALHSQGSNEDIDGLVAIAKELRANDILLSCALMRCGTLDLKPYVYTSFSSQNLNINLAKRARDHLILRVKLRGSEREAAMKRFRFGVAAYSAGFKSSARHEATGFQGDINGFPPWPANESTCAFELEIVGTQMRLTQGGLRIWEKTLPARPTTCASFSLTGFTGPGLEIEKCGLEVSDNLDFTVESVPASMKELRDNLRKSSAPKPVVAKTKMTSVPEISGVKCAYNFRDTPNPMVKTTKFRGMQAGYHFQCDDIESGDASLKFSERPTDGFTIFVEYAAFVPKESERELRLLGVAMKGKEDGADRMSVRVDTKTGLVSAVAQNDAKRWTGDGAMNLKSTDGFFAVTYDYGHGLCVYQREENEPKWRKLVSSEKCRYKGEKPSELRLGPGFSLRGVYFYPKSADADELNDFTLR